MNAIIDTFATNDLIVTIAKRIIEVRNKRIENDSVLKLLNKEISNIDNKIANIIYPRQHTLDSKYLIIPLPHLFFC